MKIRLWGGLVFADRADDLGGLVQRGAGRIPIG
jgi:hypothetical protein